MICTLHQLPCTVQRGSGADLSFCSVVCLSEEREIGQHEQCSADCLGLVAHFLPVPLMETWTLMC